jgi:hypothetical protein
MIQKLAFVVFLTMMVAACSVQQTIHNVEGSRVPTKMDGSLLSIEEVKRAILDAAIYKRWHAVQEDIDTIKAEITVRGRHSASITIDYSPANYSILLNGSEGLKESGGKIHRNYNKWIILLDKQIQDELTKAAAPS